MTSNLSSVVSKVAPILGGALSAINPVSGFIISSIAKLFGADPNNQQDIIDKINADADAALKLKQFELEHQYDLHRIVVEDKKSARDREVQIVRATGKRDWVVDFIALFMIIGFFSIIMIVSFTKMDQSDHDILYLLVGQLSGGFLLIVSYYFGSSLPGNAVNRQKEEIVLPPPAETR